ncbi:DUF4097 family beta strand repeat-containing protein [Micromonospora sp. WMMD736]|uniref:DUF4097 family beta strand repeat-containing protein n=1 Tax=Micromonospora sp. WMMD736 TaxID=3404112 RepID=UPI003B93976D
MAIRITTDREAAQPRIDLRLVNSTQAGEHQLSVTDDADGARVVVGGNSATMFDWARGGEITVVLPPDLARRLSVQTRQDAGVVLAQADLDQLIARTTHGPVLLSGTIRRVEVHTVHGDVISRRPIAVADAFTATTADGDITVDFRDAAPDRVEATTRNGDVVLGLPGRGPYLVRAQAGDSTKVQVPETNNADAAAAEITARSDDGDVVIETVDQRRFRN